MTAEFVVSPAQRLSVPGSGTLGELRDAVAWSVRRSCVLLDEERFEDWVGLFDEDALYRITAHSPEIRKTMVWLELDRDGLADLVSRLRFHLRKPGRRTRLATVMEADPPPADERAVDCLTRVAVYETDEKGRTQLWCVASYRDRWVLADGGLALSRRVVDMETRVLDTGSLTPV